MKNFSLPADFKEETIDKYAYLNEKYYPHKIIETYGQITDGNYLSSGRNLKQLPKTNIVDLEHYIKYSRNNKMDFSYTLNASSLQNKEFTTQGIRELKLFLAQLYSAGVRSLTVALPSLIELIKSTSFDFKIKASAVCQITTLNKALSYQDLGADKIVLDESINRDFKKIKEICEVFRGDVEIIVNALCYKDCIYRMFHYNQISCDSLTKENDIGIDYYSNRCLMKRFETIGNFMRLCWIRPEDINHYSDYGVRYFKIQGRQALANGNPVKTAEAYLSECFDGNLLDLIELFSPTNSFKFYVDNKKLDGFLLHFIGGGCSQSCSKCNYCDNYALKSIDKNQAEEVIHAYNEYKKSHDLYTTELLNSNIENRKGALDIEFNI